MQIRTETCVLEEPNKYVKNHYFVYSTWISTISTIRLAMLCCFWFMLLEALTRINNSEPRSKKKKRSHKYINELELSGSSKPCLVSFREFMTKVVVHYKTKSFVWYKCSWNMNTSQLNGTILEAYFYK